MSKLHSSKATHRENYCLWPSDGVWTSVLLCLHTLSEKVIHCPGWRPQTEVSSRWHRHVFALAEHTTIENFMDILTDLLVIDLCGWCCWRETMKGNHASNNSGLTESITFVPVLISQEVKRKKISLNSGLTKSKKCPDRWCHWKGKIFVCGGKEIMPMGWCS